MNLDSLSFALSHISSSVTNLTKKNTKTSVCEISEHLVSHKGETECHLYRTLFSKIDFNGDGKSTSKDYHQIQYLIQECPKLINKCNFVSLLCAAIDKPLHIQKSLNNPSQVLPQLSRVLRLSVVQELAFAVALLHSVSSEIRVNAVQYIKRKVPAFVKLYSDKAAGETPDCLSDLTTEVLHLILSHILSPTHCNNNKTTTVLPIEQRETLLKALCKAYPIDQVPPLLEPLLYHKDTDRRPQQLDPAMSKGAVETSIPDMLMEVGCGFTASVEECRNTLVQIGAREFTEISVAHIISKMLQTSGGVADPLSMQLLHGGPTDADGNPPNQWNMDTFVTVLSEIAPQLNWREVVVQLDHPGFYISSKVELRMLMNALFKVISDIFPVDILYGSWTNAKGQLSWLSQALKNPDVFCLADYPKKSVAIEMLKTQPDDENRDISTWKSLDLVEALLRISEREDKKLVLDIFKFPVQHCPDMFILALLQIPILNQVKYDLLVNLIPLFLNNHVNSAVVLHFIWHCSDNSAAIRNLLMGAMASWYLRSDSFHDQAKLARILDVAQDLKALALLLNLRLFDFVVDLACLASRREYLKLDKWLSDKMREHKEPFISAVARFLKLRCPQLMGPAASKEDQAPPALTKSHQLPIDTIHVMLQSLQSYAGTVTSPGLSEVIMTLVSNGAVLLKNRQIPNLNKNPGIPTPAQGMGMSGVGVPTPNPSSMDVLNHAQLGGTVHPLLPPSLQPSMQSVAYTNNALGSSSVSAPFSASMAANNSTLGGFSASNGFNTATNFPTSLASLGSTPGSPAKSFPPHPGGAGIAGGGVVGGAVAPSAIGPTGGGAPGATLEAFGAPGGGASIGLPPNAAPQTAAIPTQQALGQVFPTLQTLNAGQPGYNIPAATMGLSGNMGLQNPTNAAPQPGTAPPLQVPGVRPQDMASRGISSLAPNPNTVKALPNAATMDTTRGGDSNVFPNPQQQFSSEIDDEANSIFQKIFNPKTTSEQEINECLKLLRGYKESADPKENQVFACMLRNLFEEYRYFTQYPEKELKTTAMLFGGIIEQGLVTYIELGMALRYVLEALKNKMVTKMYYFGIAALDRFKRRLKDYPQYCQHLSQIPHFPQFPEHLKQYVEYGAQSQEPPSQPQGVIPGPANAPSSLPGGVAAVTTTSTTVTVTSVASVTTVTITTTTTTSTSTTVNSNAVAAVAAAVAKGKPSIANATNIDTLLAGTEGKEEVVIPPEHIQDKVFFIFNNLSLSNMDHKTTELKELLSKGDYKLWLAQYMVMKRSSIEPNFHLLYATFLDALKYPEILTLTIAETFRNIKVLLRSEKGVSSFSDRTLLKNLGHWIGMLTLAKNKPILYKDINLKGLLYEAYYKGGEALLYVVPFVAKVLESTSKSKVFKPPNPWTMGIMNALKELHEDRSLKLNLKFEIEVLCKNLFINLTDLKSECYLQDPDNYGKITHQLSINQESSKELSTSTPLPVDPIGISIAEGVASASNDVTTQQNVSVPNSLTGTVPAPDATGMATTPGGTTVAVGGGTQAPRYAYADINHMSLSGFAQQIIINENLTLLQTPGMKQVILKTMERTLQDLLGPVVERSVKVSLTTCEHIIRKDFALDPEEPRIRACAQHMIKNMCAGMALITCREPLLLNLTTNLKAAFTSAAGSSAAVSASVIEHAAQTVASDNVELACCFIQKTAVERALPEMDKKLERDYDLRKNARIEGRRYCDPAVLTYQAERMPEHIRLKVGGVTSQQLAVYEEFARSIPGFVSTNPDATHAAAYKQFTNDESSQMYEQLLLEIDNLIRSIVAPGANPLVTTIHMLRENVLMAHNTRDPANALKLLQETVKGMLEGLTSSPQDSDLMNVYKEIHLLVLKKLQVAATVGPQWTNKQITKYLMEYRDETKYNIDGVEPLIKNQLVNMQQYDVFLAQAMDKGLNYLAVSFCMQLVKRFCIDSKSYIQLNEADFYNTIDTLSKIALHSRQAPDGLAQLVETIRSHNDNALLDRNSTGPTSMMHSGISQAREFDDPPGLHEKTEFLLREWVNMYHSPAAGKDSTKAFSAFVGQMHQQGILRTDDLITRFFRLCTEMCVDLCYRALGEQNPSNTMIRAKCFHTLDAFVRLISLLVKHSGDTHNSITKINLLNKVLGIVAGVLLQDHEVRQEFQQLPYHRIFIMLFIELNAPERVLENINFQVLTACCNTFHILRPAKAPGFAFAWLELVSHRVFVGRMLAITPQHRGWSMYAQLLIDLFKFLAPFLRNAEVVKGTHLLYKGTLRVLLVLLHDFPEFLCDFHYAFCDVIPPNCIQMRNLILSAFPRNMRLPDPFTPNLKVDKLQEINHEPRILTNFAGTIKPVNFKNELDSYLEARTPVTFLSDLRRNLQRSNIVGQQYDISLINALVLYVGTQAIGQIHQRGQTPSTSTIAHSAHMDIFQNLAADLDTEGRYLFLNAIANQLRYPNSHTHYFSCTLLYLFAEANIEAIQEQITRVLLERLIVNRPHPWGLLITFIELIKNPNFKFWSHEFVHCAPEIHKLFESVARSCMTRNPTQQNPNDPAAVAAAVAAQQQQQQQDAIH